MEGVFIDYSNRDVSLRTFVDVLLDHLPTTISPKRHLRSDGNSTVLVFLNGHGGDNFLKFQVQS